MGRPTIVLDVGALMGSSGRSDGAEHPPGAPDRRRDGSLRALWPTSSTRRLSGVASSGQTDSGRFSPVVRDAAHLAQRSRDRRLLRRDCNDVSKLPPEFSRAERFDGVFFVDLPGPAREADDLADVPARSSASIAKQPKPVDTDWTGAEIRACCRLSALLDVPLLEAGKNIVPVAVTAAESVDRLRTWASGRCLVG